MIQHAADFTALAWIPLFYPFLRVLTTLTLFVLDILYALCYSVYINHSYKD